MRDAEIPVDQCEQQRLAVQSTARLRFERPLRAFVERACDAFGDEVLARREMPVEAAMRQRGFLHQVGHADTVDTALAEAPRRRFHDPRVTVRLLCLRMTHGRTIRRSLA